MKSEFNPETNVWKGVQTPYPIPMEMHLSELVINTLKQSPKHVAQISYDEDSEMTCEDLRVKIIRVAQNLKKLGIKENDVIGFVSDKSLDQMAFVNGILQLGAVVNAMSPSHGKDDLIKMFRNTEPKIMICNAEIYDKIKAVLTELQNNIPIFTTFGKVADVASVNNLLKPTGQEDDYQITKFDNPQSKLIAILPTSGTSGSPKSVCISQAFFMKFLKLSEKENTRSLCFSGLSWVSGFGLMLVNPLTNETSVVTKKSFTPEILIDIATKYKTTHLTLEPPKLTTLFKSPLLKTFDTSNVKVIATSGMIMSVELRKKVNEVFPKADLLILYGLSEVSGALTFPGMPKDDLTVGYVLPNHLLKVVDDDGNALGIGKTGEILLKYTLVPLLVRKFVSYQCHKLIIIPSGLL